MKKLFNHLTLNDMLLELLPSFALSLILAESFYKFGSFTLECLAFLATWYLSGRVIQLFRSTKT